MWRWITPINTSQCTWMNTGAVWNKRSRACFLPQVVCLRRREVWESQRAHFIETFDKTVWRDAAALALTIESSWKLHEMFALLKWFLLILNFTQCCSSSCLTGGRLRVHLCYLSTSLWLARGSQPRMWLLSASVGATDFPHRQLPGLK